MSLWSYVPDDSKPTINIDFLPKVDYVLTFGHNSFIYRSFRYTSPLVALLASIPYLFHFGIIVVFGVVVFIDIYQKSDRCKTLVRWRLSLYLWTFGMVNLLGVLIQLCFPTAPPWWYEHYQPPATYNGTIGHPAELGSVDAFLGIEFFHHLYSQSTSSSSIMGTIPPFIIRGH